MAKKKKVSKKKAAKPVEESVVEETAEESEGEEVESTPAIVEEPTILVRGKDVGGAKMMTQTEYDAWRKNR